jgi:phosphoglycerate dehydrogenase-like enzyme
MKMVMAWLHGTDVPALRAAHPAIEVVEVERERLGDVIEDADAVYGWVTTEELRAARRLKWVHSPGAGVEWVHACDGLADAGVTVTNTRGAHAQTIAEHTFAMLLYLTRGLGRLIDAQRERRWAGAYTDNVGLSGMTIGVVGLGRIGSEIARRAHAFDMRVIALDAQPVTRPPYVDQVFGVDGLTDLVSASDVIAIAIPITPETRGMFHGGHVGAMRPGSYLMVLSRGGIVDEAAVAASLHAGHLAGAGFDVFENEPLEDESPLWRAPNVLLTPHVSGTSRQTTALNWGMFVENVGRFLRGHALDNVIDVRRGY